MSRVISLLTCVFVLAVCLTATVPQAQATVVFADGSENSTVGVLPGVTDPEPGTWNYTDNDPSSLVLTKTGATGLGPTAAYAGSNYLEIGRGTTGVADVGAMLANPVDVTTYGLHAEFQMWTRNSFTYQSTMMGFLSEYKYLASVASTPASVRGLIYIGDRGDGLKMYYNDIPTDSWTSTGLSVNNMAWNKVTMDWDPTTSTFTVGVNASSYVIPTAALGTATLIDRLQFFPAGGSCKAFYDDILVTTNQAIPEPSTLALLATGLLGLLAYAWRKRR